MGERQTQSGILGWRLGTFVCQLWIGTFLGGGHRLGSHHREICKQPSFLSSLSGWRCQAQDKGCP